MKHLFEDKRGWIALAVIIVGIAVLGFTKMLARHTNITLVIILGFAAVATAILNYKRENYDDEKELE